jgi:predicted nucleic-acid-binding protein
MRAVDTSVLVRLLVRDDPDQVGRAEAFVARGAWISLLVLTEAVWVLESVYGLTRSRLATVVSMLLEHDRLTLQNERIAGAHGL